MKKTKGLEKVSDILYHFAAAVTGAFMIFLTVLVVCSVIMRFIFNNPVQWQYEATLLCLSYCVFIGMSMTFKKKEHMSLTLVTSAMKPSLRRVWLSLIDVLLIAFLLYSAYLSLAHIQTAMKTMYKTIPFAKGMFYLPYPVGCLMSVVHLALNILERDEESVLTKAERDRRKGGESV